MDAAPEQAEGAAWGAGAGQGELGSAAQPCCRPAAAAAVAQACCARCAVPQRRYGTFATLGAPLWRCGTGAHAPLPLPLLQGTNLLSATWMHAAVTGVAFCGPACDEVAAVAYDTDELRVFKPALA